MEKFKTFMYVNASELVTISIGVIVICALLWWGSILLGFFADVHDISESLKVLVQ